jgi:hypothetical protein
VVTSQTTAGGQSAHTLAWIDRWRMWQHRCNAIKDRISTYHFFLTFKNKAFRKPVLVWHSKCILMSLVLCKTYNVRTAYLIVTYVAFALAQQLYVQMTDRRERGRTGKCLGSGLRNTPARFANGCQETEGSM